MSKLKAIISLAICLLVALSGHVAAAGDGCGAGAVGVDSRLGRDDLGGAGLDEAIRASLRFLQRQPPDRLYRFGEQEYGTGELVATLTEFLALFRRNLPAGDFAREFEKRFAICAAGGSAGAGQVLVTGYFEPSLEGSLRREPPFVYPLYHKPADLVTRDGQVGRVREGRLVPYWSRAQIENEGLLAGQELVYLDDPVEAFILHVQGSGRVRLRDGKVRRIQFAAKNGLPYQSVGKLLVERGKMELATVSLPAIVDYLNRHPAERREILQQNQSFIFFSWGADQDGGPLGRLGEPLTAGRSVALDHDFFPPGALGFLQTRKPLFDDDNKIVGWAPLHRFVVNQDSGSAIKGRRRVDLFLGVGEQARTTAGLMKHPGNLYFPVRKK